MQSHNRWARNGATHRAPIWEYGVLDGFSRSAAPKANVAEDIAFGPVDVSHVLAVFDGPGVPADHRLDGPDWISAWPRGGNGETFRDAAVLVPVVERPGGLTLLFTRRTAHLKSHSGQISFPGGRMEPEDGSPEGTALRETTEEIGLPADKIRLAGRLNVRETGSGYRVVPVVGLIAPPIDLVADPNEVDEIFEVPLDFLVDPANHRFETRVRSNIERQFYAIPYGEHFIWGLTARFIVDLSRTLRGR